MRRLLSIALVLTTVAALAVLGSGAASPPEGATYLVEFDNAFGLIEGGDLKVAGVRAGKLTDVRLDRRSKRAIVEFRIDADGFGGLREDARCDVRPQSLIGEYFVDCLPGTASRPLPDGTRIPVERTSSTVPPDLVNTILRRPQRERLSVILSSLGAGLAGNGPRLNAAIRRAVPALRETDEVLARLARQDRVLADLARDTATVVGDLAANRKDVGRFVTESRETAEASAARRDDIAAGFRKLPEFLRELERTMPSLGRVADEQGPALRTLAGAADELETAFERLGPFADASRPATRALGEASVQGRRTVLAARPVVGQLGNATADMPEVGKNLAIVLEHIDNRENAFEKDPRSPGGQGYTGLEAFLQYLYDQTASINVHDGENHILKVAVFESHCAPYHGIEDLKENGDPNGKLTEDGKHLLEQCQSVLGPYGPGVTDPDPTVAQAQAKAMARRADRRIDGDREVRQPQTPDPVDLTGDAPAAAPTTAPDAATRADAATAARGALKPEGREALLDYLLRR